MYAPPVCRVDSSLCGPPVAFGSIVTYAPWRSYTFAIVWLLAKNRSVWEYLVCLDAITYGLTYHVRFVYCLCWGPPVPEST